MKIVESFDKIDGEDFAGLQLFIDDDNFVKFYISDSLHCCEEYGYYGYEVEGEKIVPLIKELEGGIIRGVSWIPISKIRNAPVNKKHEEEIVGIEIKVLDDNKMRCFHFISYLYGNNGAYDHLIFVKWNYKIRSQKVFNEEKQFISNKYF